MAQAPRRMSSAGGPCCAMCDLISGSASQQTRVMSWNDHRYLEVGFAAQAKNDAQYYSVMGILS